MMSYNLEHISVPDKDSSLSDSLLLKIKASSAPSQKTPVLHNNSFGKVNRTFSRFVIEYIAMSLYFDYWGDHAAMNAPCPYNKVRTSSEICPIYFTLLLIERLQFECILFRRKMYLKRCTTGSGGI